LGQVGHIFAIEIAKRKLVINPLKYK